MHKIMVEYKKSNEEENSPVSFFLPRSLFIKLSQAANENKTDVHTELVKRLEQSFEESAASSSDHEDLVDALGKKMQEVLTPIRDMSKSIVDFMGTELNKGVARFQEKMGEKGSRSSEATSAETPSDTEDTKPVDAPQTDAAQTGMPPRDYSVLDDGYDDVRKRVEAKHDFIEEHGELFQEEMAKDPEASLEMIFKRVRARVKSGE